MVFKAIWCYMFYTVRAIILQSFEKICKNGNYVIYVDYSLVLQLHIEDGRILNSNEQKYLMLNKSFGGHQLEINHHLLEDSQNLDSAIARKNTCWHCKISTTEHMQQM